MATHSSILAWEIPWTEEPGRLQSRSQSRTQLRMQGPLTPFTSGGVANYRCSVWGPLWRYLVLLVVWPPWRGGWKISLALCPIPLLYALIYLPISQRIWTVTPALKDIVFPSNSHQSVNWTTVQHEEVDPARTGYISHYVTELLVSTKPPGCGLVFYIIFRQQVFLAFLHIPGMSKHCWPSKISENTLELWTFYLTFRFIHCIKIKGNINRRWSEEVKRKQVWEWGVPGSLWVMDSWSGWWGRAESETHCSPQEPGHMVWKHRASKSGNSQQSNVARWTAWGQACLDSEDKGTMTRIHDDIDLRHNLSNMLRSHTHHVWPSYSYPPLLWTRTTVS